MQEVIRIEDRWYVLATSAHADDRTRVVKHGETFGVFNRYGDIQHLGIGEQGLYHEGTRFLSHAQLNVNGQRPMLLNSSVTEDNALLVVDQTTPDIYDGGRLLIRKGTVHIFRAKLLWQGVQYEHVRVSNFGDDPVALKLEFEFDADYADIFEVRGTRRTRRGRRLPTERSQQGLYLGYEGLDGVSRRTRIEFAAAPAELNEARAGYVLTLDPGRKQELYLSVACEVGDARPAPVDYLQAFRDSSAEMHRGRAAGARLTSSNALFNDWLDRSAADLQMLASATAHGAYPYAGVPWFSTPFGRDGIITALQYLWVDPGMARGVLGFLAATQADALSPEQDAEPGKILHETRRGEMAALGEVPFGRYYGSIDATPLFVVLAWEYYARTGDRAFVASLWPHVERALAWIDDYGDRDGDGFVEYARMTPNGLAQQGWKDSEDSVFHADGSAAPPPIALCEVQGYVYQARLAGAELATLCGQNRRAVVLRRQAEELREHFNQAFWCEELGTFALALDGDKRPCRVRTSNAGHALWSGIVDPALAERLAATLLSEASFSGWGVRTVAHGEARYNPMSYHNGSIWPHDNALVAMGLGRYGFKEAALKILAGLFDTSIAVDLHRLPELFCGFERLPGQPPTLYPVACSPQAWACSTVFGLLQACLGLSFAPEKPQLRFDHPRLPDYLAHLEIRNLQVGEALVDLSLSQHPSNVSVRVLRKTGDAGITVIV